MKKQEVTATTKLLLATFIMLIVSSCGTPTNNSSNLTKESRTVEYDKESMYSEISNIIQTGDTSAYSNANIEFDYNDICNIDDNAQRYFYRNSIYVQTSDVMYRFQLDKDYNIISYIKYRLEG